MGSGQAGPSRALDASALRDWAHTAVGDLITHIDEINRLNVFPVADSDTGVNMLFTMRSALAEANTEAKADDVVKTAAALSAGALHGARGNSGVILSQILRGIADVTAHAAAEYGGELPRSTPHCSARRCTAGSTWSSPRWAVGKSRERSSRCSKPPVRPSTRKRPRGCHMRLLPPSEAAVVALEKTPEQLDVLGEAGVVDAGGRGLLVLLDALRSTVTGQAPSRTVYEPAPRQPAPDLAAPAPGAAVRGDVPAGRVRRRRAPTSCASGWTNSANRWPSRRPAWSAATRCTSTPTTPARRSRRVWCSAIRGESRFRC